MWNILHDLNFHPYKMVVVQELSNCDMAKHSTVAEHLIRILSKHIISLRGELPQPARLPDLSACSYFLWGYLKAKVYTTTPRTIDDLKITIQMQISVIPENMAR
jgi:hypothetical protein